MTTSSTGLAQRRVQVGRSTATDAAQAGAEAARAAGADLPQTKLVLVFCSARYDLPRLLSGVCSAISDDVTVAGCTTDGEIIRGGAGAPTETGSAVSGPGVVVAALGGPGFTMTSTVVPHASDDRREAGAAAGAVMASIDAPHQVLLMIADGMTKEQHELVRGAYSVVGLEVPIVGGCSANGQAYSVTYQFHGTGAGAQAHTDALVAVGIGSTGPIGVGIAHGWVKSGEPMLVTSSELGEVFELDDEPALDVYLRRVGADRTIVDDADRWRDVSFRNPLGMSRRTGEDIRAVHAVHGDRSSLQCLADVPQGALVWTMTTDPELLVQSASQSCAMAVAQLGDVPARGLLVFDCSARKLKLGAEHLADEQAAIAEAAGDAPVAGFYTYGEIARTHGSRGMHHLTVVALALA
jgi:hypothetical protein